MLGTHQDGVIWQENGDWQFAAWYQLISARNGEASGRKALKLAVVGLTLMAAAYYIVDVRKWGGDMECIKYFGMNSIAAYMIANVVDFSSVTESFIYGLKDYVGEFYPVLVAFGNVTILFFIMRLMYKNRIFLKV